jgi:hypothetical protein
MGMDGLMKDSCPLDEEKTFFLDELEFGCDFNVGPLPGLGFSF